MSSSYAPMSASDGQAAITRPYRVGSGTATLAARLAVLPISSSTHGRGPLRVPRRGVLGSDPPPTEPPAAAHVGAAMAAARPSDQQDPRRTRLAGDRPVRPRCARAFHKPAASDGTTWHQIGATGGRNGILRHQPA